MFLYAGVISLFNLIQFPLVNISSIILVQCQKNKKGLNFSIHIETIVGKVYRVVFELFPQRALLSQFLRRRVYRIFYFSKFPTSICRSAAAVFSFYLRRHSPRKLIFRIFTFHKKILGILQIVQIFAPQILQLKRGQMRQVCTLWQHD